MKSGTTQWKSIVQSLHASCNRCFCYKYINVRFEILFCCWSVSIVKLVFAGRTRSGETTARSNDCCHERRRKVQSWQNGSWLGNQMDRKSSASIKFCLCFLLIRNKLSIKYKCNSKWKVKQRFFWYYLSFSSYC